MLSHIVVITIMTIGMVMARTVTIDIIVAMVMAIIEVEVITKVIIINLVIVIRTMGKKKIEEGTFAQYNIKNKYL